MDLELARMKGAHSPVKSSQHELATTVGVKKSTNGVQNVELVDGDSNSSYSSISSSSQSTSSSSPGGSVYSVIDNSDDKQDERDDIVEPVANQYETRLEMRTSEKRKVTEADDDFFEYLEAEVRSMTSESLPLDDLYQKSVPHLPSYTSKPKSPLSPYKSGSRFSLPLTSSEDSEEDDLSEDPELQGKHSNLFRGHGSINHESEVGTQVEPTRENEIHFAGMADSDIELITIRKRSASGTAKSPSSGSGSSTSTFTSRQRMKQPPNLKEKEEMARMVVDALMPYFRNKIILNEAEFKYLAKKLTYKALRKKAVRGSSKEKVAEYIDGKFKRVGVSIEPIPKSK